MDGRRARGFARMHGGNERDGEVRTLVDVGRDQKFLTPDAHSHDWK
jgi:hypothetical protein